MSYQVFERPFEEKEVAKHVFKTILARFLTVDTVNSNDLINDDFYVAYSCLCTP